MTNLISRDYPSIARIIAAGTLLCLLMLGCASAPPLLEEELQHYRSRAITRSDGGINVSASTLSAAESQQVYGFPLSRHGIQPVWIQVENNEDQAFWLMSTGLDPNFFPASEAAEAFVSTHKDETREVLIPRFQALAFRDPIPPGKTVSGFILTNLDEGVKLVHVDLVAERRHKSFSFFTRIPGFRADYLSREKIGNAYSEDEYVEFSDDDAFRAALESLPCCVTNKDGSRNGDPLNLVIVGGIDDAFPALIRRGWRPTEQTWYGSVMKMIKSGLSGDRYPYAPISPLFLYGRPQDLALQKARDNIHQRNHLRLWMSPMRYRGKPVWVGQISRDIGTRITIHSPYLTTHKIDPDVDEARTALQEDMAYSQSLVKLGLVNGVGAASRDAPRRNLTRDPYYTDGFRGVLIFDMQPTSLADIEFLPWEGRKGGFIEQIHGQDMR